MGHIYKTLLKNSVKYIYKYIYTRTHTYIYRPTLFAL